MSAYMELPPDIPPATGRENEHLPDWIVLYRAGRSTKDIAEQYGVARNTVLVALKSRGEAIRATGNKVGSVHTPGPQQEAKYDRFADLLASGRHSVRSASREMGFSRCTGHKYANRAIAARPGLADVVKAATQARNSAIRSGEKILAPKPPQRPHPSIARRAALWPEILEMRERGATWWRIADILGCDRKWAMKAAKEAGYTGPVGPIVTEIGLTQRQAAALSGHVSRLAGRKTTPRQCLANDHDGYRCTKVFQSTGPGHRLCHECRGRN